MKGWKASYLYGRGVARFYQKRYEVAMRLLEKAFELDPNNKHNELSCSYLGRSYLMVENFDKALELLSRSYELYSSRRQALQSELDRIEFLDTLKAFSHVLRRNHQIEKAQDIERETMEFESHKN